ncbi:hypothetical protein T265_08680 [Opisthorchis viverrini]|uniref:Uncharacterized protein n=1 Tax=Opisthorchis viverrini TaxID=6198 RepID=A0A074ZCU9_OPIVI|nr:hypothetical protein T265_08680 [Opisthorchis viverrini]KER23462.1 hypothetical protein T265_08680 [Opisthorchis viverrini]
MKECECGGNMHTHKCNGIVSGREAELHIQAEDLKGSCLAANKNVPMWDQDFKSIEFRQVSLMRCQQLQPLYDEYAVITAENDDEALLIGLEIDEHVLRLVEDDSTEIVCNIGRTG